MKIGETKGFDIDLPRRLPGRGRSRGKPAHFEVTLLDLRERILPELDDEFAASVGELSTVDELRAEIRDALARRGADEARHHFADRIIDFATANATVELPEVMIANEIEIMRDELRNRLAAAADRDGPVPRAGPAVARGAGDRAARARQPPGEVAARPVRDRRAGGDRRHARSRSRPRSPTSWRAIPTSRGCGSTSPRAAVAPTCA